MPDWLIDMDSHAAVVVLAYLIIITGMTLSSWQLNRSFDQRTTKNAPIINFYNHLLFRICDIYHFPKYFVLVK